MEISGVFWLLYRNTGRKNVKRIEEVKTELKFLAIDATGLWVRGIITP